MEAGRVSGKWREVRLAARRGEAARGLMSVGS